MATEKFKEESPYKRTFVPPEDDYIYKRYLDDFALNIEGRDYPDVRFALFGVGRAGTIHLASIVQNPRARLLYIVDDVESKWQRLEKYWHLKDVTFLNSKQADIVYNDPKVDAVIVATPTFTHEEIVTKSLQAKKAIFCEKPVAENRENMVKCFDIACKMKKPLFCGFNRRFDPSYSAIRKNVRKGDVGHIQVIKTVSRDSPLPSLDYLKISGGIFHDCMVHDIDIMTWILGEYPIRVAVQAHAHIPEIKAIDDFDTVVATLYFPSGTLGMINLSRFSNFGYDQRLEVFGSKGMIDASNERPIHCVTKNYGLNGPTLAPIWYSFSSRYLNGYRLELEHFIDVFHGKAESSVKAKEILAVCKVATACEESARTEKMVNIQWNDSELP